MGYLEKQGALGGSIASATGELPSHERRSSKCSTSDDMETCKATIVQAHVSVHAVDRMELENNDSDIASDCSSNVKELEGFTQESFV